MRVESPAALRGKGVGKFRNQGRAVGAGGSENVRMLHAEVQRAIAPHGDAADSAGLATCNGPILVVDCRDEFLDEEILVALMAVKGIDVETLAAFRHHDDEFADLSLAHQAFPGLLPAVFTPAPRMFEEAVQEVKHRVAVGALFVAGRERHAILHCPPKDGAGNGLAIDAGGGGLGIGRKCEP